MYINDLGVKEINQYYAQHGGRRTALIKGFANYMENAKISRISTHSGSASAAGTADTGNPVKTETGIRTARQTAAGTSALAAPKTQSDTERTGDSTAGASGNGDSCCDKCRLTRELMLRMMTNNLYTQSGLGYSAMGSGALAAYQSLSRYFGNGLFS